MNSYCPCCGSYIGPTRLCGGIQGVPLPTAVIVMDSRLVSPITLIDNRSLTEDNAALLNRISLELFEPEPDSYWLRIERIQYIRSTWKHQRPALLNTKHVHINMYFRPRRMMVPISGWLGRKGYKRRTGK